MLELKITITKIKVSPDRLNSRYEEAEENIQWTWRQVRRNYSIQRTDRKKTEEKRITPHSLWNNTMCTNIHAFGVPEVEGEKEENLLKILSKNFPNLAKTLT